MADTASTTENTRQRRKTMRLAGLFIFVGILFTMLIFGPMLFSSGFHSGEEFSPDDFSRRTYTYHVMPLLNITTAGIKFERVPRDIGSDLVAQGLLKPTTGKEKSWHLVHDSSSRYQSGRSGRLPKDCDARLLTAYLDRYDAQGNIWSSWNQNFPSSAAIFWPEVAELARDEMYLRVPDVMEFALAIQKDEPKKFQVELDALMADVYSDLAELDLEMDQTERSQFRAKKSLSYQETKKAKSLLEQLDRR